VSNENLEKFKNRLLGEAEKLTDEDLKSVLNIDAKIEFDEVDWEIYDYLKDFEPYGQENVKPKFLLENLKIKKVKWVGNGEKHVQIQFQEDKVLAITALKGIAFNFEYFKDKMKEGDKADVVFEIDVNEWNGNRELQLMIKDLKIY
jgi:single-stranded-DNA-specific exonuclease